MIRQMKDIKKKIKKLIIIALVTLITVGGAASIFLYNAIKGNVNYTLEAAKEIALGQVPGEVISVERDIEVEDLSFEYEVKIKDQNNMLREVSVDALHGMITDID